jgi:hypothetical protein
MTGVTVDDVLHLTAVDYVPPATATGRSREAKRTSLAATSSVQLTYTVSVDSSALTADQLFAQLNQVVASGAFTTSLYNSAVFFGAPALQTVSSSAVTNTAAPPTTDDNNAGNDDNDSDSSRLKDKAIIGIAVAGGFVAFLLGGFLVYCCMRRPKEGMASQHGGSSA